VKRLVSAVFTVLLVASASRIARAEQPPRTIRDRYLVLLHANNADVRGAADDLARRHGGKVLSVWTDLLRGFAIELPAAAAKGLAADSRVASIEEDQEAQVAVACIMNSGNCNDGRVPWQLDRIDQDTLPLNGSYYPMARDGYGATIYVVDSGVRRGHPEFLDVETGLSRVSTGGRTFVNDGRGTEDCYSHGTYVASFAAGLTTGPASRAAIVPVRVLDCQGRGSAQQTIDALNWIAGNGRGIVNISLYFNKSTAMDTAATNLVNKGFVVVVAAGNDYMANACNYSPGRTWGVITVGATTSEDRLANFTNVGSCVSIFAPGWGVGGANGLHDDVNCSPGWNGTSVAAPQAAGVAALIWGNDPSLSGSRVAELTVGGGTSGVLKIESAVLRQGTPNLLLHSAAGGGVFICHPEDDPDIR
jgi:subtilisin family serine protease